MNAAEAVETACLTADVVLIGQRDGEWHVLLIERGWPPFEGYLALPGGQVNPGETVHAAGPRELTEETGLTAGPITLVDVYSTPGRDPRGRYVTWAWMSIAEGTPTPTAGDDARSARWWPLTEVLTHRERLAFDHHRILLEAACQLPKGGAR